MRNILTAVALLLSLNSFAQNYEKLQGAFEKSYNAEDNKEYENAILALQEVYLDDSYEINLRLGWLYYQKGDLVNSEKYYSKAMEILPYSEEAKIGIILPKTANAKWNEIIDIYKQILTISPNNTLACYHLGYIYYNQKKYGLANVQFEKIINLYPFDYDALLMYGWSNLQLGKFKKAKIIFNKVLMLSPHDKSAIDGLFIINKK